MRTKPDKWLYGIQAAPWDVSLRRTYADWLSKRGATRKAEILKLSAEQVRLRQKEKDGSDKGLSEREYSRLRSVGSRLLDLSYKVDSHWLVKIDPELAIPPALSELGKRVAESIVDFLGEGIWEYSGYGGFFDVPENAPRHELLKAGPVILVVHHSDELQRREAEAMDNGQQALDERLKKLGVWSEPYDESTLMIYPLEYPGTSIGLHFVGPPRAGKKKRRRGQARRP